MPDKRYKTVLEFDADVTKLRNAGQSLRNVFDTKKISEYSKKLDEVDKKLSKVAKGKSGPSVGSVVSKEANTARTYARAQELRARNIEQERRLWERTRLMASRYGRTAAGVFSGQFGAAAAGGVLQRVGAGISPAAWGLGLTAGVPLMMLGYGLSLSNGMVSDYLRFAGAATKVAPYGPYQRGLRYGTRWGFGPDAAISAAGQYYKISGRALPGDTGLRMLFAAHSLGIDPYMAAFIARRTKGHVGKGNPAFSAFGLSVYKEDRGPASFLEGVINQAKHLSGFQNRFYGALQEYITRLLNISEAAIQRGVSVKFGELMKMTGWYASAGISGLRTPRLMEETYQGLANIGYSGNVKSSIDYALLRAAGFTGGAESYAKAMFRLQNPTADLLPKALFATAGQIKGSNTVRALYVQRILASLGITVGAGQAQKIAERVNKTGALGIDAAAQPRFLPEDVAATALEQRASRVFFGAGGGALSKQAGIAVRRIGVGRTIFDSHIELQKAQTELAKVASEQAAPALQMLASTATNVTQALSLLMDKIGKTAQGPVTQLATKVSRTWSKAYTDRALSQEKTGDAIIDLFSTIFSPSRATSVP